MIECLPVGGVSAAQSWPAAAPAAEAQAAPAACAPRPLPAAQAAAAVRARGLRRGSFGAANKKIIINIISIMIIILPDASAGVRGAAGAAAARARGTACRSQSRCKWRHCNPDKIDWIKRNCPPDTYNVYFDDVMSSLEWRSFWLQKSSNQECTLISLLIRSMFPIKNKH